MDQHDVNIDLDRLRAVANRVERSAHALGRFRFTGLDADLPGSEIVDIMSPTSVAATLDDLIAMMVGWAAAARIAAQKIEGADTGSAHRIGRA